MATVTLYVGLDYHQHSVQVCIVDALGTPLINRSVSNDTQAITALVAAFGPDRVEAALEACTGAAALADELVALGWCVSLAHPGYVSRMKTNPDKTDWHDARILADLLRVGYLPNVWLAPESIRELKRMVRYRQTRVEHRKTAKLRISALLREHRIRCPHRSGTKAWREFLEQVELPLESSFILGRYLKDVSRAQEDIQEVERMLKHWQDDPFVKQLLEQPGIGLVTALVMRAEIGRADRFRSGKQLARFCGLSPRNASSGQRQADAGLIPAGNTLLKTVLIEAAQRLVRFDEEYKKSHQALVKRGKPYNLAVAAVANRWVRRLYHEIKSLGV